MAFIDKIADYKEVLQVDWQRGARNEDDDFHTDVVFLRVSTHEIRKRIGTCHTHALLLYSGYCGEFFYPSDDTSRICRTIIHKLMADAAWGLKLNDRIYQAADRLTGVFQTIVSPASFSGMTRDVLIKAYIKQFKAQTNLYMDAWIPEILQVDHVGLTDYLKSYLRSHLKTEEEVTHFFHLSTSPDRFSVYLQEALLLQDIADEIIASGKSDRYLEEPVQYIRLELPHDIRKRLHQVRERYQYFAYHGFGSRAVTTFDQYLLRVLDMIRNPKPAFNFRQQTRLIKQQQKEKESFFRHIRMDDQTKRLFTLYGEFGVSKAYRRLAQLKNFYFLDQMIETIADCFEVPEGVVRFMPPEEIIAGLQSGKKVNVQNLVKRTRQMVYFFTNGQEYLFTDDWIQELFQSLQSRETEEESTARITGSTASPGFANGRAVVVTRPADCVKNHFIEGDIIVSVEADPDLFEFLKKAGAVVTDQGGVTCHVAILAREFGIPCVTGTGNATRLIKTGDQITVDADRGTVELST